MAATSSRIVVTTAVDSRKNVVSSTFHPSRTITAATTTKTDKITVEKDRSVRKTKNTINSSNSSGINRPVGRQSSSGAHHAPMAGGQLINKACEQGTSPQVSAQRRTVTAPAAQLMAAVDVHGSGIERGLFEVAERYAITTVGGLAGTSVGVKKEDGEVLKRGITSVVTPDGGGGVGCVSDSNVATADNDVRDSDGRRGVDNVRAPRA